MDTTSSQSPCKEKIRESALTAGFSACGFAEAAPVDGHTARSYRRWLDDGKNASMHYMGNHLEIRDNPALLLPGAKTVISLAMNYYPQRKQPDSAPQFSYYAYGKDYHDTVRRHLEEVARFIKGNYGGECRCCVDTAPIRERYWAQKCGIGFVGKNNQLIIPGKGSYFFLGEIVTTLRIPPDKEAAPACGNCRRCADRCPTGALAGDFSALDARRCISCMTIEHRGILPEKVAEKLGNRVYGCDECQKACPYNRFASPTGIEDFAPSDKFLSLSYENMAAMTEEDYRTLFRKSAVKRAKYAGLMRNLAELLKHRSE